MRTQEENGRGRTKKGKEGKGRGNGRSGIKIKEGQWEVPTYTWAAHDNVIYFLSNYMLKS